MSKKRILWVGDSPTLFTGFGRVAREVLTRLHATGKYDITCLGWYYDGRPYDTNALPFEIYRTGNTEFGQDVLGGIIEAREPDVMISLGDIWMVQWIQQIPQRAQTKWVGYFPLDGGPLHSSFGPVIRAMDVPVCYSKFAQDVIAADAPDIHTELIYHGVDADTFHPIADKVACKREEGIGDRFVVGCVARNQARKQIPILVKAFARFAEDKDDVFLYLHMAPRDAGWDMPELLRRYRLQYKAHISGATVNEALTDEQLNGVYNCFDVFALPTMGEGFGLPIVEAMACGVPVVVTDYSACVELVEGRGELIKVRDLLTLGQNNIDQAVADVDDLTARLEKLYADPSLRQAHGHAGRQFAETLAWDALMPQWTALIDSLGDRDNVRDDVGDSRAALGDQG